MINWKDFGYLQAGNPRQRHAYAVLQSLELWTTLAAFDPVLAGTIPLAIDTPTSDLDVLCEVAPAAQELFRRLLTAHYGSLPAFHLRQHIIRGEDSLVCSFRYAGTEMEVFGQAVPTTQQFGFRHLLVEHAILQAGGETWRHAVQQLKEQGLKTEPAFAALLQLPGNPYEALLTLEGKTPAELAPYLARCPLPGEVQANTLL